MIFPKSRPLLVQEVKIEKDFLSKRHTEAQKCINGIEFLSSKGFRYFEPLNISPQ